MIEGLEQDKLSGARSVSLEFRIATEAESTPPPMELVCLRRMSSTSYDACRRCVARRSSTVHAFRRDGVVSSDEYPRYRRFFFYIFVGEQQKIFFGLLAINSLLCLYFLPACSLACLLSCLLARWRACLRTCLLAACVLSYSRARSTGGRCEGGSAGSAQAKKRNAPKTTGGEKKVPWIVLKKFIFRLRRA